jgi:replicative DNA helicase
MNISTLQRIRSLTRNQLADLHEEEQGYKKMANIYKETCMPSNADYCYKEVNKIKKHIKKLVEIQQDVKAEIEDYNDEMRMWASFSKDFTVDFEDEQ